MQRPEYVERTAKWQKSDSSADSSKDRECNAKIKEMKQHLPLSSHSSIMIHSVSSSLVFGFSVSPAVFSFKFTSLLSTIFPLLFSDLSCPSCFLTLAPTFAPLSESSPAPGSLFERPPIPLSVGMPFVFNLSRDSSIDGPEGSIVL